jgi:hypothetical protein
MRQEATSGVTKAAFSDSQALTAAEVQIDENKQMHGIIPDRFLILLRSD